MMELGEDMNLVICQKSKINDWINHFNVHYGGEVFVYDLTDKKELEKFFNADSRHEMFPCIKCIGVINYDLVWRRSELKKLKDFTLLLDESSLIQTETTNRTKFILGMEPKNVILLSGTPTGGKYEKLWSQMHLLGWKISKKTFYDQYVNFHFDDSLGFKRMVIDGYKNEERLKRKMRQHGCQFLKTDEVFDLPEQIEQKIYVDVTKKYKFFRKNDMVTIDGEDLIGDTTLNKMLRERQLCGMYNKNKIAAFKDLLESTEDRIVVFYNFTDEWRKLSEITDELERTSAVVNGQFKCTEIFDNHPNAVLFVQYQAGAMGLNLQKANKIVYFTPPLSSELFEQSKKRIHRIGQKKTCFYYYLTCVKSIEEKIYKTLAMRKDYTERLFEEDEQ